MLVRTKPTLILREIFGFALMIAAGLFFVSTLLNGLYSLGLIISRFFEYGSLYPAFIFTLLHMIFSMALAVIGFWAAAVLNKNFENMKEWTGFLCGVSIFIVVIWFVIVIFDVFVHREYDFQRFSVELTLIAGVLFLLFICFFVAKEWRARSVFKALFPSLIIVGILLPLITIWGLQTGDSEIAALAHPVFLSSACLWAAFVLKPYPDFLRYLVILLLLVSIGVGLFGVFPGQINFFLDSGLSLIHI